MTLLEWARHKYPNIKNESLLVELAGLEAFNPTLPAFVERVERTKTYQHDKSMRRIAKHRAERGL